jgi:hypothetical protein
MKLSLETNFGSPNHFKRLVEYAKIKKASSIVLADYSMIVNINNKWKTYDPFLYRKYPGLLTDREKEKHTILRNNLKSASRLTSKEYIWLWTLFEFLKTTKRLENIVP